MDTSPEPKTYYVQRDSNKNVLQVHYSYFCHSVPVHPESEGWEVTPKRPPETQDCDKCDKGQDKWLEKLKELAPKPLDYSRR